MGPFSQTGSENAVDPAPEGAPGSLPQTDPVQGGETEEGQAPGADPDSGAGGDAGEEPAPSQPKKKAAAKRSIKEKGGGSGRGTRSR